MRILIVDEDHADRRIARHRMGRVYDVDLIIDEADDMDSASKFVGNRYDLIFCDLNFSFYNSAEIIKDIVKLFPKDPVIAISGIETRTISVDCQRFGAQAFLCKDILFNGFEQMSESSNKNFHEMFNIQQAIDNSPEVQRTQAISRSVNHKIDMALREAEATQFVIFNGRKGIIKKLWMILNYPLNLRGSGKR